MTGARLGRGRGGRLALYGGCLVVVVLLVFLYRAATTEMTRLRDLHVQCAHQQEALAAQLQVIFEYKVRLEKSLAEEKSANTMAKQELQQRATREKSLRDKDSIESMQRFNSLQQQHKLLQSEHQDLKEECDKRQKLALEESTRLEATLQDLRSQIHSKNKDYEEKEKMMEHLKNKYFVLDTEKSKIEEKYNNLMRNNSNRDSTISHLSKEIIQLQNELEQMKSSCKVTSSDPNLMNPRVHQHDIKPSLASISSSRPQVSNPSNNNENPIPIQAPRDHQPIGRPEENQDDYLHGALSNMKPNKINTDTTDDNKLIKNIVTNKNSQSSHDNFQMKKPSSNDGDNFNDNQEKPVLPIPNDDKIHNSLN